MKLKLIGLKLVGLVCGGMLFAVLCGLEKRLRLRAMMFSVQRLCLVKRMLPFRKALVGLAAGCCLRFCADWRRDYG